MFRAALALIALVALPSMVSAQSLTLAGPMDETLETRIRGQLSDLPWTLARDPSPPPPIQAVLDASESRVVVWVSRTESGAVLHLLDREERRLLARAFDRPTGEAHPDSTLYESIAVSLRSSLRALSAGGTIGVVVEEPEPEPEPPEVEPEPEVEAPEATSQSFVALGVGWWGALDGVSSLQTGPSGSLSVGYRALRVGAAFQFALGTDIEGPGAQIRLARHGIVLELGGAIEKRPVELTGAVRVGAFVQRRETVAVDPPLIATPGSRVVSAAIGARVGIRAFLHDHLSLRLDVGADGLAPRPRYEANGGLVAEPWTVQPFLNLSLEVHALTRSGREPPP